METGQWDIGTWELGNLGILKGSAIERTHPHPHPHSHQSQKHITSKTSIYNIIILITSNKTFTTFFILSMAGHPGYEARTWRQGHWRRTWELGMEHRNWEWNIGQRIGTWTSKTKSKNRGGTPASLEKKNLTSKTKKKTNVGSWHQKRTLEHGGRKEGRRKYINIMDRHQKELR
ncbi:uncharacterized protein EI97DRAFT_124773 [Westerdykella ornata]|uniref:Uncharacterized protein n=1 Tax=Westerdykella ornata TaxID=318751 RepID=A0A6A6JZL8_WESOR|nr:uncharacterized protein EI97DRAFT_124773 [Westerdykella ornata]KAF2280519.1 hypothetical protein EI97DRAFT_124773 [Westerdykella ornata]